MNGLTEDWSKVGRVCRAGKDRWNACDGAPSPQEESEQKRESARIGMEARIAEAYAALEAMLEDEERRRPQSKAEEAYLPYEMAEDRYHGTTEEGAGQNTLPTCGERTTEDNARIPIVGSESGVWRFQAPQPETPNIGESNPGGVCVIGKKIATDHEEPVAMDKSVNR